MELYVVNGLNVYNEASTGLPGLPVRPYFSRSSEEKTISLDNSQGNRPLT